MFIPQVATAALNAALLKPYKGSRPYIRKWHFPDYARLEQFPGYDGKMKMIFVMRNFIELPTVQLFAPNQIQILQFLNQRSSMFIEKFTMRLTLFSIL
jgi:hypothetical protein